MDFLGTWFKKVKAQYIDVIDFQIINFLKRKSILMIYLYRREKNPDRKNIITLSFFKINSESPPIHGNRA